MTTSVVIVFLALMGINGFLAMARSALINVRKVRLRQLAEEGSEAARAAERLAEDANRLLATTQLGMMLTTSFAGARMSKTEGPPTPLWGGHQACRRFLLVIYLFPAKMMFCCFADPF